MEIEIRAEVPGKELSIITEFTSNSIRMKFDFTGGAIVIRAPGLHPF